MTGEEVTERDYVKIEFGPDADIVIIPRCCKVGSCGGCRIAEDLELVLQLAAKKYYEANPWIPEARLRLKESRSEKGGNRCRFEELADETL